VNVALTAKPSVTVSLPARGTVTDAATGKPLDAVGGKLRLSMGPCQLRAIHIR